MNEQTPPQPARGGKQLSHAQFYKVCECLRKHKQEFLEVRPSQKDAAKRLSELSGFSVSDSTMGAIREATGITWQPKYKAPSTKTQKTLAVRTLTTALFRLYRKLNEEAPKALIDLYAEETGRYPAGMEGVLGEDTPHE